MSKIKRKGYTVEVDLGLYGYDGYSVECTYRYIRKKEKYLLHMGLMCQNMDGCRFRILPIDLYNIDAQYIHGTKETIVDDIDRIVEYAATHEEDEKTHEKFFDKYINQINYMFKCCEIGNEILEEKRLSEIN